MKKVKLLEEFLNEAKYSFTLTYNDAKYVQKVLDDAGVDALAKAGVDDEEVIVRAFDGMGLRRAKQALEADHFDINESVVNEAVKEVVLSNEILDFLEERGILKRSDAQKVHKDLTAFLKEKGINESVVNEADEVSVDKILTPADKKKLKTAFENVVTGIDKLTFKKDGTIEGRRGYFYRHGQSPEGVANQLKAALSGQGIEITIVDSYDDFKSWPKDSNFVVVFKLT
jgi:hypothetical protein